MSIIDDPYVWDVNRDPRNMAAREREEYGVTVSFEADNGHRLTLHHTGSVIKAIRSACAVALSRDESYRVLSISTPTTIYGDLKGRGATSESIANSMRFPEVGLMSRAGLTPLLHPSIARWSK